MQFSFMTEPQAGGSYADLLRLARWAESAGFESFARSDHYMNGEESAPATDAMSTVAGLARDTDTIKLTVLMTPVTFRHPATLAKTAATIDEMSGGRLELGVGTGWMSSEHERLGLDFPPVRDRFSHLYETLAYLEAALDDEPRAFSGRHFSLEEVPVLPGRTGRLPIIVGGSGPIKTPTFAGRFADEFNMFSCDEESQRARTTVMRQAAEDAGRDPESVLVSFVGYPIVGENRAEVADRIAERAEARGIDADEYRAMLESRSLPVGTADQVQEQFIALEARGIGRYYLQVYAPLSEIDTAEVTRVLQAARGS